MANTGLSPSTVRILWSVDLPGDSGHRLWADPTGSSLYVSDGWGIAFSALRLCRLSLRNGTEESAVRLGNQARCLCATDDGSLLAATDSKLFRLDRVTLAEVERWDKRMPKYADEIHALGKYAVQCNWRDSSLRCVNLSTGAVRRRSLGGYMHLLPSPDGSLIAACGSGSIWRTRYDLASVPEQCLETAAFAHAALDAHRTTLWLSLGDRAVETETSSAMGEPTSIIACCDLANGTVSSADLGHPFWRLALSPESDLVWAFAVTSRQGSWRETDLMSFARQGLGRVHWLRMPEGFTVHSIRPDLGLGWATMPGDGQGPGATMICFAIPAA